MKIVEKMTTGTPSILINKKLIPIPPKIQECINTYLDWLYNAYKENDENFNLTPEEFVKKQEELFEKSWGKVKH